MLGMLSKVFSESGAFKGDDGLGEGVVKLHLTSHHGGNFEQRVDRTLEPGETSYHLLGDQQK